MEQITETIKTKCLAIAEECGKPTKAAHRRIRSALLELSKLRKEYNRLSLEADKKKD